MLVLSPKPLKKLNGTDGQADGQDHVLSQADALTKNGACWTLIMLNSKVVCGTPGVMM